MNAKLDKFTAARIRRFTATGMAVQKALPFERPRFGGRPQMLQMRGLQDHRNAESGSELLRRHLYMKDTAAVG
jgi:hypothetical protein